MRWNVRTTAVHSPLVVAHSGCNGSPANTLASIAAAKEAGADAVEFDVQVLADGYPVLVHDPWIPQDGGMRVSVETLTRDGVTESPELPSIGMVCDACATAGLRLNLDIKNGIALPAVLDILKEHGFLDWTFLTGCRLADVGLGRGVGAGGADRSGRAEAGGAFSAAGSVSGGNDSGLFPDQGQILGVLPRSVDTLINVVREVRDPAFPVILDQLREYGFAGVNIEHTLLNPEIIDRVHRRGLIVGTWTVDDDDTIHRVHDLAENGATCDYVTTSVPDHFRSVYDSRGRRDE